MSKKKDLYVKDTNRKRYEYVLSECKRRGVSPSDLFINAAYKSLLPTTSEPALNAPADPLPVSQDKSVLKTLIKLGNQMQEEGIDGMNLTYVFPRMFETGEISITDTLNLLIMMMKFNVIVSQTQVFKDALLMTSLEHNSIRCLESDEFDGYRNNLLQNIYSCHKKDLEERQKRQKILEKRKEQQEWTRQHPDIPYHLRNLSQEEIEMYLLIERGEWVEELEA